MSWNGSGIYSLPALYFPEAAGNLVDATRYNGVLNDISSGLNNALTKDGQNTATANLPMGGFRHTGAANATSAGEYVTYAQPVLRNGALAATADLPMGGFKHTGAAVATATGQYVTWNQASVRFPTMGIGTALNAGWDASAAAMDIGTVGGVFNGTNGLYMLRNSYWDGAAFKSKQGSLQAMAFRLTTTSASIQIAQTAAVPDEVQTYASLAEFFETGFRFALPTSPISLTVNSTMTMTLTSDTNLRISCRGTDGVTRVSNITLA